MDIANRDPVVTLCHSLSLVVTMTLLLFLFLLLCCILLLVPPTRAFATHGQSKKRPAAQSTGTSARPDPNDFDTIVIGSGMGGLTVASLLVQAQKKHRVLVLEQHPTELGGKSHSFCDGGLEFVTNARSSLVQHEWFDCLVPSQEPLSWTALEENNNNNNNNNNNDSTVVVSGRDSLETLQIDNRRVARRYQRWRTKARKSLQRSLWFKSLPRWKVQFLLATGLHRLVDKGYSKYARLSVSQVARKITRDPALQRVITAQWSRYGTPPEHAPWIVHAWLTEQPQALLPGGPTTLVRSILDVLQARGALVLPDTPVSQIVVERGKAVGVQLASGQVLRAQTIVSDAGYINTYRHLIPLEYRPVKAFRSKGGASNGPTGLTLYVGLRGEHQDWNLSSKHVWAHADDTANDSMDHYPNTLKEAVEYMSPSDFHPVWISCPTALDPTWYERYPGRTALEISTLVPWNWFEEYAPIVNIQGGHRDPGGLPGKRGAKYEQQKAALAQKLWSRARQALLQAGDSRELPALVTDCAYHTLETPLTYAHFTWASQGSYVGLDHNKVRFSPKEFYGNLRPDASFIKGLYLTGQDVFTTGVQGSMIGGFLCASRILGLKHPKKMLKRIRRNRVLVPDVEEEEFDPTTVFKGQNI